MNDDTKTWRLKVIGWNVSRGLQGKSDLESVKAHGYVKPHHDPAFCNCRCLVCYPPPIRKVRNARVTNANVH